jgi:hypothetical protein
MKSKKIKNRHVLIVGAGSSLLIYWKSIKEFIDNNNVITVGINRINHILIPDYHLWADGRVYKNFGHEINKKSILIFGDDITKLSREEHWSGPYKIIRYTKLKWKASYDDPTHRYYGEGDIKYNKKTKEFHGVFRTAGSLAILWSHIKKASKISVVGMDGYTFYPENKLREKNKIQRQHCYGKGFTDAFARNMSRDKLKDKKKSNEFYKLGIKKDADVYKTLRSIKKYGVKFEILTPTVYKDFYNPKILNIE